MGGWHALALDTRVELSAIVAYYAIHDRAADAAAPAQLHFAEEDEWERPDAPELYAQERRARGAPTESWTYPGTAHSFANADIGEYNSTAAATAWGRTVRFLNRHLR